MSKTIGGNRNTYTVIFAPDPIQLSSTEWTLVSELAAGFPTRIGYKSTNDSNSDFFVLEKTPLDDSPRGFTQFRKTLYESQEEKHPIGPIYMMAKNGNPFVMFEEF